MAEARDVWRVGVLAGDGIGPEVVAEGVAVLEAVASGAGVQLSLSEGLLGGSAIEATGEPLPPATVDICRSVDALLVGAVGGPRWDHLPAHINPGLGGLLRLRRELDLYANLRPGRSILPQCSPLKAADFDILLVREAVGGLYFSNGRGHAVEQDLRVAWNTMRYDEAQVRRIARTALELAESRRGLLTSVDKANVLEASQLWRKVVQEEAEHHPNVRLEHLYVDNCAMQLILDPGHFDVLVTENLFGDILSDEIAGVIGSLGLLPSASLRHDGFGLYEPVHGSAPDLAGAGVANPAATILSVALMLRHTFGREAEAATVEGAVNDVLRSGLRTRDLPGEGDPVSTRAFGAAVVSRLRDGRALSAGRL